MIAFDRLSFPKSKAIKAPHLIKNNCRTCESALLRTNEHQCYFSQENKILVIGESIHHDTVRFFCCFWRQYITDLVGNSPHDVLTYFQFFSRYMSTVVQTPVQTPNRGKRRSATRSNHFVDVDSTHVRCIHCNKTMSHNMEVLRNHMDKSHKEMDNRTPQKRKRSHRRSSLRKKPRNSIDKSVDGEIDQNQNEKEWTPAQNAAAQQLLARAIYNAAIPFSFVENQWFKDFLNLAAPNFEPPSEFQIGGLLLNTTFEDVKKDVDTALTESQRVTLLIDGSSDGCSDPITHVVAVTSTGTPLVCQM